MKNENYNMIMRKLNYKKNIFNKIIRRWRKKKLKNFIFFSEEILFEFLQQRRWKYLKNRKKKLINIKKIYPRYFTSARKFNYLYLKIKDIYYWVFYSTKRQSFTYVKNKFLKENNVLIELYKKLKKKNPSFLNFYWKKKIYRKIKKYVVNKKKKDIIFFLLRWLNKKYNFLLKKLLYIYNNNNNNNIYIKFFILKILNNYLIFLKNKIIEIKKIEQNSINSELIQNLKYFFLLKDKRLKYKYKNLKKKFKRILKIKKDNTCIIKLRNSDSNFFITVTDLNNNVLLSQTTGRISTSRMKKKKMSPYLVHNMMFAVKNIIRKYKINYICLHINSKINKHMHNVINSLKKLNFCKIKFITFSKPIPHHFGQRKQKSRRL